MGQLLAMPVSNIDAVSLAREESWDGSYLILNNILQPQRRNRKYLPTFSVFSCWWCWWATEEKITSLLERDEIARLSWRDCSIAGEYLNMNYRPEIALSQICHSVAGWNKVRQYTERLILHFFSLKHSSSKNCGWIFWQANISNMWLKRHGHGH